ncbi:uncharacterized protein LOC133645174 isoform X2 [Entelurus aequoreus]|uniref:uncharacterized protein LOC133645174 isoform X2 n=1 Tax=Entelurus aequoreus TaxID=161455 RepID=UPI002B1D261D|nr:uncharacterized protein LOC133645174 isoform X2 [Entelurus aequoreus]
MCEITIAEYKEELSPKEETERQHQLLDAVFKKPEVVLHGTDVEQLIGRQEEPSRQPQKGSSTLKQEDPQPPHIKEEEYGFWTMQEEADPIEFPLAVVSVNAEDHEDNPPTSSQLHPSPSEKNRAVEPSRRSSPQRIKEADGGGGSKADRLLAPLSVTTQRHTLIHTRSSKKTVPLRHRRKAPL